jgi:hypothetical protein
MEDGFFGDAIHRNPHAVQGVPGHHLDPSLLPTGDIRRGPDAFQRVPQLSTAWAHVVRLVADPDQVIEPAPDGRCRQSWTIVLHTEGVRLKGDGNIRENPRGLAGIKRVVDQFLQQGQGPVK